MRLTRVANPFGPLALVETPRASRPIHTGKQDRNRICYRKRPQQQQSMEMCKRSSAGPPASTMLLDRTPKPTKDVSGAYRQLTLEQTKLPTVAATSPHVSSRETALTSPENVERMIDKTKSKNKTQWSRDRGIREGLTPVDSISKARELNHLIPLDTNMSQTRLKGAAVPFTPLALEQTFNRRDWEKAPIADDWRGDKRHARPQINQCTS